MTVALGTPYEGYLYAYPHKSAYRPFSPPRHLAELWRNEDRRRLHLYVHVPFCGVRCGFCNLFTQVGGGCPVACGTSVAVPLLFRWCDRRRWV